MVSQGEGVSGEDPFAKCCLRERKVKLTQAGPDFSPGLLTLPFPSLSVFKRSFCHQLMLSLIYPTPPSPQLLCSVLATASLPSVNSASLLLKCQFWNNRRTCCFCGISGKNFILIHLVLRALTRNVFRDPRQPPSLCGSHLVVGDFTGTFLPEMSIFLSFFLRCLCLSDYSVLELWQFLIYFQAGGLF